MKVVAFVVPVLTLAAAGIIDRIAVTVGNQVITESEVLHELRLTALMNGQPPDLSPTGRKAAADRLVDQQLIRNEMEIANFPKPTPKEVDAMLQQFRQEHPGASLDPYGLTEDDLRQYLLWQLTVMRFTDQRFRAALALAPNNQSADRQAPGATDDDAVDQQMDAWLKQQRSITRIVFKKGAFDQ